MRKKVFLFLSVAFCLVLTVSGFFLWRGGLALPPINNKSEAGQALGAQSSAKDRLPTDIPTYPSALVTSFNETLESIQVVWETGDTAEQVKRFYRNEMDKNGWQRSETPVFFKDKGRQAEIKIISETGEKTYFSLDISQPRP